MSEKSKIIDMEPDFFDIVEQAGRMVFLKEPEKGFYKIGDKVKILETYEEKPTGRYVNIYLNSVYRNKKVLQTGYIAARYVIVSSGKLNPEFRHLMPVNSVRVKG